VEEENTLQVANALTDFPFKRRYEAQVMLQTAENAMIEKRLDVLETQMKEAMAGILALWDDDYNYAQGRYEVVQMIDDNKHQWIFGSDFQYSYPNMDWSDAEIANAKWMRIDLNCFIAAVLSGERITNVKFYENDTALGAWNLLVGGAVYNAFTIQDRYFTVSLATPYVDTYKDFPTTVVCAMASAPVQIGPEVNFGLSILIAISNSGNVSVTPVMPLLAAMIAAGKVTIELEKCDNVKKYSLMGTTIPNGIDIPIPPEIGKNEIIQKGIEAAVNLATEVKSEGMLGLLFEKLQPVISWGYEQITGNPFPPKVASVLDKVRGYLPTIIEVASLVADFLFV
jgi:hypothetical protein